MRALMPTASIFALMLVFGGVPRARADNAPTTRPMLDELNRETTALYQRTQTGIYRIELPQPKWVNAYAMAAVKHWDTQLDPDLRRRLEQSRPMYVQGAEFEPDATTRPGGDTTSVPGQGTYIVVRPDSASAAPRDPVLGGTLTAPPTTQPGFTPNNIGLLLDDRGHILVPLYVEREAVGNNPVKLAGPDGQLTTGKFIGSDRQTNLTLLQVDKPSAKPVRLGSSRPAIGSLVLCLAPADGSGRLGIWTDGAQNNGIIVTTSGDIAGVAHYGQFLAGSACELIVRQLEQYGAVRRATLGVLITEIRPDDPLRRQQPVLGVRSAMRIDQVIAGSAADKGGLKPGDFVLAIAGESVSDLPSFAAAIAARNGPTELQILRAQRTLRISVDLQQQK
jgi:hypothetical protein